MATVGGLIANVYRGVWRRKAALRHAFIQVGAPGGRDRTRPAGLTTFRVLLQQRSALASRHFIQLQRQVVRVGKEGEATAGVFVHADRLGVHAVDGEMGDGRIQILHAEGQVAQATRLRAAGAQGAPGKENSSIWPPSGSARSSFQESRACR